MIISVPEFGENPGAQLRAQSGVQSRARSIDILTILSSEGEASASELVVKLGLKSKTGAFKRTLQSLLEDDQIESIIPDKPNSRLQKYRLTQKGRNILISKSKNPGDLS